MWWVTSNRIRTPTDDALLEGSILIAKLYTPFSIKNEVMFMQCTALQRTHKKRWTGLSECKWMLSNRISFSRKYYHLKDVLMWAVVEKGLRVVEVAPEGRGQPRPSWSGGWHSAEARSGQVASGKHFVCAVSFLSFIDETKNIGDTILVWGTVCWPLIF